MKGSFWRSIVVMCLAQGLATALSPGIGILASGFIGIYVACRLWFVDHPIVWWYDLLFLAVLVGTALGGAGIFAVICGVLPSTGYTTRACQSLGFERALWWHIWMLGVFGGILWFWLRLWIWWKLRQP